MTSDRLQLAALAAPLRAPDADEARAAAGMTTAAVEAHTLGWVRILSTRRDVLGSMGWSELCRVIASAAAELERRDPTR